MKTVINLINKIIKGTILVFLLLIKSCFNFIGLIFGWNKTKYIDYYECLYKKNNDTGYLFESDTYEYLSDIEDKFENLKSSKIIENYKIVFDDFEETNEEKFEKKDYPCNNEWFENGWVWSIENKKAYPKTENMPEPQKEAIKSEKFSLSLTYTLDRDFEENETVESLITEDFAYYIEQKDNDEYASIDLQVNVGFDNRSFIFRYRFDKNSINKIQNFIEKVKTQEYTNFIAHDDIDDKYTTFHLWKKDNNLIRLYIQSIAVWDKPKHIVKADVLIDKNKIIKEIENLLNEIKVRLRQ